MGDVLRGAAALCLCKLACSLASVPSLSASHSPVSLCCCCLLIFTDVLVTVFLSFLYLFQSWLPELTGDVIALRFLLFLSHMYGEVLLLIIPLIAVDTLSRLLEPYGRAAGPTPGSGGRRRSEAAEEQQEASSDPDGGRRWFHVGCYLCCLSVWVVAALNVRWRWELEEMWSVACVHTSSSLIGCLPRLFPPIPVVADPCWGVLFLLLLLATMNTGLRGPRRAPAQTDAAPVGPASSVSDPAPCVDPGKTQSSCTLHTEHFWSGVQMPTRHHGDSREHKRTKGGDSLTFLPVAHGDPQRTGFPRRAGVMVVVLSIFVLPLNLSVNVLAIRTVETLMELGVQSLVSLASNTKEIPAFHNIMLV